MTAATKVTEIDVNSFYTSGAFFDRQPDGGMVVEIWSGPDRSQAGKDKGSRLVRTHTFTAKEWAALLKHNETHLAFYRDVAPFTLRQVGPGFDELERKAGVVKAVAEAVSLGRVPTQEKVNEFLYTPIGLVEVRRQLGL